MRLESVYLGFSDGNDGELRCVVIDIRAFKTLVLSGLEAKNSTLVGQSGSQQMNEPDMITNVRHKNGVH